MSWSATTTPWTTTKVLWWSTSQMYLTTEINLQRLDFSDPSLESTGSSLEVQGKKGLVRLDFRLLQAGEEVGQGAKYMALRGLQPYKDEAMQRVVDEYNSYKRSYITP
jgi:hypothetical protein